jgi:hypothetical protein
MCTGMTSFNRPDGWISVNDRLPDCNGKYLVAYHPAYWDNVRKKQKAMA